MKQSCHRQYPQYLLFSNLSTSKPFRFKTFVKIFEKAFVTECIPNHFRIKAVGNGAGGRVFIATLSSAGILQIRNCDTDYTSETLTDIGFRFDYYLM